MCVLRWLVQVEAEASIPDQLRCYCPNPRCSVPFLLEAEPAADSPVYCPACSTKICAFCSIVWHEGCGCKEYQVRCCLKRWSTKLCLP